MRGMQELIDFRMGGLCPSVVLIDLEAKLHSWRGVDEENGWAHLLIERADPVRDLRALVKVPLVLIDGFDWGRVDEVARAAVQAGAGRVIAHQFKEFPWGIHAVRIWDSTGALTWQE